MSDTFNMPSSVLVVDDDEIVCIQIVSYLFDAGVSTVDYAHDGAEAWVKIRSTAYDFIVLDWKLPSVSGLALFNRIRRMRQNTFTPVLVVSGLLNRDDFRMLNEFPATALVEKPFTKMMLLKNVSDLYSERVWYSDNIDLIDDLCVAVKNDPALAMSIIKKSVLPGAPNPLPLAIGAAKKLRESGSLSIAAKLLKEILLIDPRNIQAMSEIGKVLHIMGRHREALNFLKEANVLAPQNLSRLCLMGEAELNLCSPQAAKAYFSQAVGIDDQDVKAQIGIKVANDIQSVLDRPEHDHIPRTFASLLNIMGVSLVRSGSYSKGLGKYKRAMRFLHQNQHSARVAFNLGLGYLRWGKPKEALDWFLKSDKLGAGTFEKSRRYVVKLQLAVKEMKKDADGTAIALEVAQKTGDDFVEEPIGEGTHSSGAVGVQESIDSLVEKDMSNTNDEEPEIASDKAAGLAA